MASLKDLISDPLEQYEPQSFDLLPVGVYVVEIIESELVDTKEKTGVMLKLTHEVIEPAEFAKRRIWKRINVANRNADAERIGRGELRMLRDACGMTGMPEAEDFIGQIVKADLVIRKARGDYPEQNEIRHYESARADAKPAGKPAPAPAPARSAGGRPWEKKTA